MRNNEFENYLPREVYLERSVSLAKSINPKPYTEEVNKIKDDLREQKRL